MPEPMLSPQNDDNTKRETLVKRARHLIPRILTVIAVCATVVLFVELVLHRAAPQKTVAPRGTVRDQTGAPIPNATIEIVAPGFSTQKVRSADDGSFVGANVPTREYNVTVSSPGFTTLSVNQVDVGKPLDITLRVGSTSETVSVSAGAENEPVYNAIFSETLGQPNQLADNKATHVAFFIGPKNQNNALSSETQAVNTKIRTSQNDIPLFVIMNCTVCETNPVQTRSIVYHSTSKTSDHADFVITPTRRLTSSDGSGQIIFVVRTTKNGDQDLDRTVARVSVGDTGSPVDVGMSAPSFPELSSPGDDLTIIVSNDDGKGTVELHVGNQDLRRVLAEKKLLKNNPARRFAVDLDQSDFQSRAFEVYTTLKAITDQQDAALQSISARTAAGLPPLPPSSAVRFSDADYQQVIDEFLSIGSTMYRRLFVDQVDAELHDAMIVVRNFNRSDGKPLRVRILSRHLYFPWQLLHPPGTRDEKLFWGFRYILSVDSLSRLDSGRLPGPLSIKRGTSNQLFLAYKGSNNSGSDDVPGLSKAEREDYDRLFGPSNVLQSTKDFINTITLSGPSVATVIAFTHGTSGIVFRKDPSGAVTSAVDVRGPQLLFALSGNDYVNPSKIESVANNYDESVRTFFEQRPFVFLNACETSAGGIAPLNGPNFQETLLHMGARAVIGTEAPVWALFAYHFGGDLLKRIGGGTPIPDALHDTRVEFLQFKNPLGLLYSYYGAEDAAIIVSN